MAVSAGLFRLHRALIAPDRRGPLLAAARAILGLAAVGYRLGSGARNRLYRAGWISSRRADVPVISVGNITAGGTGKTPFVAWLARLMVIQKMRPAILSRGYGRDAGLGVDDENALLRRLADEVPVVVDPDRIRGAGTAIRRHEANVLILDDGFQHRRIARDLDIVLLDAVWPFGAGHLLPRGLLREPLRSLRRADFLLITRTELVDAGRLDAIKKKLEETAPDVPVACSKNVVQGLHPLREGAGGDLGPEALKEGRWAAFCGIGNPEGFRLTLEKAGCDVGAFCVFSDHQRYRRRHVERIAARARAARCDRIVTTEKDAVKVERLPEPGGLPPVYVLRTGLDFTEGSAALVAAIVKVVERGARSPS